MQDTPEGHLALLNALYRSSSVQVPLPACPECGGPLQDLKTHEQMQVDLPTVRPVVTRFVTQSGYCPRCYKRSHSHHPEQVSQATGAAGVSIGPRAKALATDMKHRLGIPYRKIAELFKAAFGLEVTAGGLCQADEQLARKAEPICRELVEAIRSSAAVYAEGTGWRMGVLSAWLWVFTTQKVTVYTIDESRSHEVVVEILGHRFPGVLASDCFSAYDHKALKDWLKQKCFAHLLRELSLLEGEKKRGAVRFSRELVGMLREALALGEERRKLDEATFKGKVKEVEVKLDAFLSEKRQFKDPDNSRLARLLRKQRQHLLTFLQEEGVEATINRAERALRPAVMVRKSGGCSKTREGPRRHAVLASLLQTLKKQGQEMMEYLTSVLTSLGEPPKLLPPMCRSP